ALRALEPWSRRGACGASFGASACDVVESERSAAVQWLWAKAARTRPGGRARRMHDEASRPQRAAGRGVPQSVCECCRSIWKRLLGSRSASDPTHAGWLSHRQRLAELDENSCADRPWRARGGPETGARSQLGDYARPVRASQSRILTPPTSP